MKMLMAANWKMYKTAAEAAATARELGERLGGRAPEGREVLLCAPFTAIAATAEALRDVPGLSVGAQNLYPAEEGAFTGEISPAMLREAGAAWVLTGHSERRHIMGEDDALVGRKTAFALEHGLKVVLCVGETLPQREEGRLAEVLRRQLEAGMAHVSEDLPAEQLAVAYEPVWAIGTGKVAGPTEIVEAHTLVRAELESRYGSKGQEIRILYGGSVKPDNAAQILRLDNVDGVLVGGASLKAESFGRIINA